jgi:hypothetical protein
MQFGWLFCCGLLLVLAALLASTCLGARDVVRAARTRSKVAGARGVILLACPLVVITFITWSWHEDLGSAALCLQLPYRAPPSTFGESDLQGTWERRHADGSLERLVFAADGTFKQVFHDAGQEHRVEETAGEHWWLECLDSRGVRVHLQGAKYYPLGMVVPDLQLAVESCPSDDAACRHRYDQWPYAFYDPIADEPVTMAGTLVLNVRLDLSGRLLLHQMRTSSKELIGISHCQSEHFRRVDAP